MCPAHASANEPGHAEHGALLEVDRMDKGPRAVRGRQSEPPKVIADVFGRNPFVACAAAATIERIAREKFHVRPKRGTDEPRVGCENRASPRNRSKPARAPAESGIGTGRGDIAHSIFS